MRYGIATVLGLATACFLTGCRQPEPAPTAAAPPPPAPAPSGCVRGAPEPWLAASPGRPAPVFTRTAALEATETFAPDEATSVEIRHFGCAHFGLEFVFSLAAPAGRDPGWQRAAALLAALPVVEDQKRTVQGIVDLLRRQNGALAPERLEKSETESVTVSVVQENKMTRLRIHYEVVL